MWRECEGGRDGQAVGAYGRERQGAARHRQGFREAGGGRHSLRGRERYREREKEGEREGGREG